MKKIPGRAFLRASLALWRRRVAYRKLRHDYWETQLEIARHRDTHPRKQLVRKRDHWSRLLTLARAEVALRERQLGKAQPAQGIDVSNNNGSVVWASVAKAGYRFAWCKASEADGFTDQTFHANVHAAKRAGLKVGAYHFLSGAPAAAQAKLFAARIRVAGLGPGDLLPVVDVEKVGVTTGQAVAFVDALHRELGVKPVIYTFPGFAERWPSTFGCKLWIAHFGVTRPTIPPPWKAYAAWQHSDSGTVPGVRGRCDLNTTPDLKELLWA